jgi:hypothetical protein
MKSRSPLIAAATLLLLLTTSALNAHAQTQDPNAYPAEMVSAAGGDYMESSAISYTRTLDIVILGDGYTQSEMNVFQTHVNNTVATLKTIEPFKEYQRLINFRSVFRPSVQSGVTYGNNPACPWQIDINHPNCKKDTYYQVSFGGPQPTNRFMTANLNTVNNVLASTFGPPESSMYDVVILLANDIKWGGNGYPGVAVASMYSLLGILATHELAHSFADIGDEYPLGATPPVSAFIVGEVPQPNITTQPVMFSPVNDPGRNYKWNYWITPGTPIPTTDARYPIGIWEGAMAFYDRNIWRAHLTSKMRETFYPSYGPVNVEVLVKKIYSFAPLVASSKPSPIVTINLAQGQATRIIVKPVAGPMTHGLRIVWYIDNQPQWSVGMYFTLSTHNLSIGTHTLTARVSDPTSFVLRDPQGLLSTELNWTFNVSPAAPLPNPIDESQFFVDQLYRDLLTREPDQGGLSAWVGTIDQCAPGNTSCDRAAVANSFFNSQEFLQNGYYVHCFYKVAFGRLPYYYEFMEDMQPVIPFDGKVEARRAAYADGFVARSAFADSYDWVSNADYVDTLMANAGVTLSIRDGLIDDLNNGWKTRAQVLRTIAQTQEVYDHEYNSAFVTMEYFGFLRRDPDAGGYQAWLNYLNANPWDRRGVVSGFVNSWEYRNRFGQP